ncbi:MAG: tRNA (cytidine(34)-2'-O)-methyltransferase [Chlamydiia bacterium]|nr:tRNA (cytidine(34)-2'-O)-methyltransferase [Chlamydiia bacterium]MCH9618418.1 tRNA (cytidine(34)-2'-O)-methyltransferase [Chlamydiia bacterium]MCH9623744.1 tRNA (cytidine(34)-2'-O)-methyltransferase [Chlamydiia bacterium]
MEIILFEPDIPQNTGNIIRLCKATKSKLTLITPLGFDLSEKRLRRAGLDYFLGVQVNTVPSLKEYLKDDTRPKYFLSSKAPKSLYETEIKENAILIFGSETKGLPSYAWEMWAEDFVTLPIHKDARCLNLSNAVAVTVFEALRQQSFCAIH